MITRREFGTATVAAAMVAGSGIGRLAAQARLSEADLLRFEPLGNVTLLHVTDIHAQLVPLYYREPSVNLGVGESRGLMPHVTGAAFLSAFDIKPGSPEAYALTDQDFEALAKTYGRMGGLDRVATMVKAIRAERGNRALLLDGGDTWTNSWGSLKTKGQDIADVMSMLAPDAMTGHWEFTLGDARVKELIASNKIPFLAQNIRETEFEDRVFEPHRVFERGGVKIAVIGQAFPFTPISNPRWMFPKWAFGLRVADVQAEVDTVRAAGAGLVVLLSHNGVDVDRKLAREVRGLDVILAAHTHDALPQPIQVGKTLIIASGSHGKFVSRLDLDVAHGAVKAYRYRLIPIFADAIKPDAETAAVIARHRAPFKADLERVLAKTNGTLFRRGNFAGTLDDVFCDAMLAERDAEISLSPGVRWGATMLPGQDITFEDITNASAITYPNCYRMEMTGARLKDVIEDVADNIFHPDPYYQGGGDMVRTGGLGFTIDINAPAGKRVSDLRLLKSNTPLDANKGYVVAGWASVNEGTAGPPIWEVVSKYLTAKKVVDPKPSTAVKVVGA
jgi:sulfur-oxidizing protein SoxB